MVRLRAHADRRKLLARLVESFLSVGNHAVRRGCTAERTVGATAESAWLQYQHALRVCQNFFFSFFEWLDWDVRENWGLSVARVVIDMCKTRLPWLAGNSENFMDFVDFLLN